MSNLYFYRGQEKVPGRTVATAQVVRSSAERSVIDPPGWIRRPLEGDLVLLIQEDLLAERKASDDFSSWNRQILDFETQQVEERGSAIPPEPPSLISRDGTPLQTFPVLMDSGGQGLLFSTGEVVVRSESEDPAPLIAFLAERGWRIQRSLSFAAGGLIVSPEPDATIGPIELANQLIEDFGLTMAHPVFLEDIPERSLEASEPTPRVPADGSPAHGLPELFSEQWHLANSGQNGARAGQDVRAQPAWDIAQGEGITVAVIDSGVELSHEVFATAGKLTPGHNFADGSSDPSPGTSSHGTSCAALVGADGQAGKVVGVAPRCRIMPIRRSRVGNHLAIAEAIAWAVDQGADILTCSFGIDGRPWILPDVVRAAIDHALTHGRGGLGCPIFWAAGNGNESISDDEWASHESVVAIAASTDQGSRAYYSDFGPEVDLCAPSSGGTNDIVTASNGGYTKRFGGTSAAAPIAAGVAALVLSHTPHLTHDEVKQRLVESASKIDPSNGDYDALGHSPLYGFGQVDAVAAVAGSDVLIELERRFELPGLAEHLRQLATRSPGHLVERLVQSLHRERHAVLRHLLDSAELSELGHRVLASLVADPTVRDSPEPSI